MKNATSSTRFRTDSPAHFLTKAALDDDLLRVAVEGEFDLAAVSAFDSTLGLHTGAFHRVRYDLEGVTFIDASGLRSLLAPAGATRADTQITIGAASSCVRRILGLLDLDGLLEPTNPPTTDS